MTETQRKWLTEYLGECWHSQETYYDCEKGYIVRRRTFTDLKDKQDLLEAVIRKDEFNDFLYSEFRKTLYIISDIILLSPEATAELICKWKGVE
jgi:hypothetical protein